MLNPHERQGSENCDVRGHLTTHVFHGAKSKLLQLLGVKRTLTGPIHNTALQDFFIISTLKLIVCAQLNNSYS
jgi:phosphoribosylpyrophosphate synthetase